MVVIIDEICGGLNSQEEEVSHVRVAEPTAAWVVSMTLMKSSRVIVVCPELWQDYIIGYG